MAYPLKSPLTGSEKINLYADSVHTTVSEVAGYAQSGKGWVMIKDTLYTPQSFLEIRANTPLILPNNAGSVLDIVGMDGGSTIWDSAANKLSPDKSGDTYDWRVQFTINPSVNNRNLTLSLDIGGTEGVIWDKTLRLARGAGVNTRVTETLDIFTLGTFIQNGGQLKLLCDGDGQIFDIVFKIERKFRQV